jgi:hypothetical protein
MLKAALAGAVVLAITGSPLAAQDWSRIPSTPVNAQMPAALPAPTAAQINQFHAALRLRPDQEPYWQPVERVLHGATQQPLPDRRSALLKRLNHRSTTVAANVVGLRELASAALPLVQSMDDNQKLTAWQYVNAMGYGAIVAQF